jgi:hypothetical protein
MISHLDALILPGLIVALLNAFWYRDDTCVLPIPCMHLLRVACPRRLRRCQIRRLSRLYINPQTISHG